MPQPLNFQVIAGVDHTYNNPPVGTRYNNDHTDDNAIAAGLLPNGMPIVPDVLLPVPNKEATYVFSQGSPSTDWVIDFPENLEGYPTVNVFDSTGRFVWTGYNHTSNKRVTIHFAYPSLGLAVLKF